MLNFFFFFGCVYIYNLSNKKCEYIIKKRAYVYIYMRGSCLDKYISIALGPSRQKFLAPPACHLILVYINSNKYDRNFSYKIHCLS